MTSDIEMTEPQGVAEQVDHPSHSHFLSLPRELRDTIYEHLLPCGRKLQIACTSLERYPIRYLCAKMPPLFVLSRQIRDEVLDFVTRRNSFEFRLGVDPGFHFFTHQSVERFGSLLSLVLSRVRSLTINLYPHDRNLGSWDVDLTESLFGPSSQIRQVTLCLDFNSGKACHPDVVARLAAFFDTLPSLKVIRLDPDVYRGRRGLWVSTLRLSGAEETADVETYVDNLARGVAGATSARLELLCSCGRYRHLFPCNLFGCETRQESSECVRLQEHCETDRDFQTVFLAADWTTLKFHPYHVWRTIQEARP